MTEEGKKSGPLKTNPHAFGYEDDEVITKGTRCVAVNGFSLHPATRKKGLSPGLGAAYSLYLTGSVFHK